MRRSRAAASSTTRARDHCKLAHALDVLRRIPEQVPAGDQVGERAVQPGRHEENRPPPVPEGQQQRPRDHETDRGDPSADRHALHMTHPERREGTPGRRRTPIGHIETYAESLAVFGAFQRGTRYSPPGAPTSTNTTTASDSRPRLSRSRPNCGNCSKTPRRRIGATAGTANSPTTCSRSGPRSGPSPSSTGSSRPTTLPNARSAAPSSTQNSCSARKARTVSGSLNAPSRPPPHAECSAARCSPTSANYSPPTTAATHSPRSPERPRGD